MRMRADSTVYVTVPLAVSPLDVDLSDDTFQMQFTAEHDGEVSGWIDATYDPDTGLIRTLVGPENGGTVLSPGVWFVQVKITDIPEVPVATAPGFVQVLGLV